MSGINLNKAEFIKSAADPAGFIRDTTPRIVFAGKSNVGKSSVINRVLGRKNFARVGSQPGKTVHVNYFKIDGRLWLVDLPGYGYAAVSKGEKERWGKLMEAFFEEPEQITLCCMIVDSRHKPTGDDVTMAQWFADTGCPVLVLANKCDKISKAEAERNIAVIRETLPLPEETEIIPFSAEKGTGREELLKRIFDRI